MSSKSKPIGALELQRRERAVETVRPETSYEFVLEWFEKAEEVARLQGRPQSAQLWRDGLQHLEATKAQRDKLLAAAEAVLADCGDCDTESRLTLEVGRQLRAAIDEALS